MSFLLPTGGLPRGEGLPGGGLPRGVRIQGELCIWGSASGGGGWAAPSPNRRLWDTVNEWAVRILLNAFLCYVRFVFYLPSYYCSEVQPRHSAPLEEVVTSCKKHGVCLKGIISTPMTYEGTLLETVNIQLRLDPKTIISFLIKLTNFISQS